MKKNTLLLFVLSVMAAQTVFAQVDMSLFAWDQIWLFTGKKEDTTDGIILCKDGNILEYEDAIYRKKDTQYRYKHLAQTKAIQNYGSFWRGEYDLKKKPGYICFSMGAYDWKITKLTSKEMILTRADFIEQSMSNYETDLNIMRFVRSNIKSTCLPVLEWGNTSGMDGYYDYIYYIGINNKYCPKEER